MRTNLNTNYHKGRFRCREWAKHLRPFPKRIGNKRFRKSALETIEDELRNEFVIWPKKRGIKKNIKVKITTDSNGNTYSCIEKYGSLRDLKNSINRPCVIRYKIL